MWTEASIATIVAGVATGPGIWLKTRKPANNKPKTCPVHDVVMEKLESGAKKFEHIATTLDKHGDQITKIGQTTFEIKGILQGMDRK
jgi:hypothetical protein